LYKDIVYSAIRSSCHNCLRRCRTSRGVIHRTVRFHSGKADVITFVSQLDPQTSTWFDFSAKDSSRTVVDLAYSVASKRSSSPLQLYAQSSSFFRVQQCRTPSTNCMSSPVMSNSISTRPRQFAHLRVNNVELHRPLNNVELHRQVLSQWCLRSTMLNSIDSRDPLNNVELH